MAISFVGSSAPQSDINGANVVINLSGASGLKTTGGTNATLLEDDVVIIAYATSSGSDDNLVVSGWTELADLKSSDTQDSQLGVYYKVMGASPDTTATVIGSGGTNEAVIGAAFAFRGCDTVTPIDVTTTTDIGTNTGRPTPPPITPGTSGAWVLACGAAGSATGAVFTFGGTYSSTTNHTRTDTVVETNDIMLGMAILDGMPWTSGVVTPGQFDGGTTSINDSWTAATLALRPYVAPPAISHISVSWF